MNVDEAMAIAAKQGGLPETNEWLPAEVIEALGILFAEVERLRAELAAAVAELDELVNETIKRNGWGAE